MDKKIDLTFYNQVRARFSSVETGTIVLIGLSSGKVDNLIGHIFIEETEYEEYSHVLLEYLNNDRPYAALSWSEDGPKFFFCCKEFLRSEDMITRKIQSFQLDPFKKPTYDIEAVKRNLIELGKLLSGDSKAS